MAALTAPGGTRRLVITPGALLALFAAIAAALLVRTVFVAGRRPIGWVVAAVVAAAVIEPAVAFLARRMKRGFALILVLVPLIVGAGAVTRAVYSDLDHSIVQLKKALPEAAARVENNPRFGRIATDMHLRERAKKAAADLEKPSSNVADSAVDRGGTFLVTTILTIFMLIWGRRFADGALGQVTDEQRRAMIARRVGTAFARSQAYVDASLVQAAVIGIAAWGALTWLAVPAPTPLALTVAVFALIPVVGIVVGALPAVLLIAGYNSPAQAAAVLAAVLVVQIGQIFVLRAVSARTLYVGPAAIAIAALVGLAMYGLGGAIFLTALTVFGIALLDANADEDDDDLDPGDAQPTEIHPVPGPD